jgi:aminoglycoside phosphotransferase family enzyme
LGESGRVVEYAVVMKKIPEERMLKRLLARGAVSTLVMESVARKVAEFHQRAETGGKIDELGGLDTIRRNHEENFEQTRAFISQTIPEYQYSFIRSFVRNFLKTRGELFNGRVNNHRIRDCHGDLHLEHICLLDPEIVIFDCIEFNERFRFEDVAAEVSFLAMDLDFNGYPEYGEAFVDAYISYSEDEDIRKLLNFYKCYYAYVRGKVVGFKILGCTSQEPSEYSSHGSSFCRVWPGDLFRRSYQADLRGSLDKGGRDNTERKTSNHRCIIQKTRGTAESEICG